MHWKIFILMSVAITSAALVGCKIGELYYDL